MRSALLLVLLALFAGCVDPPADDTPTLPSPLPAVALEVELFDRTPGAAVPPTTMGIDPSALELTLGVPVNLTVRNVGQTTHNLVIGGLDVASDDLGPGEEQVVAFTPAEAGEYEMWCTIGGDGPLGHRAQGMRGTVTVA